MPSAFHDEMAAEVNREIQRWLDKISDGTLCSQKETKDVASLIKPALSTRIQSRNKLFLDDRLEPDVSYRYKHCVYADLVLEVAWSQKELDLPRRAQRFIEMRQGTIRTVVGLNLNDIYRGGRKATFSIWEAQLGGDGSWSRTTRVENQASFFPHPEA